MLREADRTCFLHFKNDEERNKFVRSANMLKKFQGRKLTVIHVKHNVPPDSITTNWTLKHISVKGQIVVKPQWTLNIHQIPRH